MNPSLHEWKVFSCEVDHQVYHFSGAEPLCGLYRSLEAGPADVNILCVAELRQEFQEGADIHVVIIVDVTKPPATHDVGC